MSTTLPSRTGKAPGGWPLLGHAWQLHARPLEFLSSLPAHGDLVRIGMGPWPAYVVCEPEAAHRMLTDSRTFDKGGPFFDKARVLFGSSLPMSGWQEHRWQRRQMQPAFQSDRIEKYAVVMGEEVDRMTSGWRPGSRLDVTAALTRLTLRIVTRSVLAAEAQDAAVAEVQESLHTVIDGIYQRVMLPLGPLYRLPTPANRRYRRARTRLHAAINGIIAARRAAPGGEDLVSMLLAAHNDDTGGLMSEEDIRDQLMVMIGAGFETTANSLAFALWLLSQHPEVAAQVYAEADRALAGRTATTADLDALPCTRRVINEVLRLYPAGWFFTRVTTADTTLAGQHLPKGTALLYSAYLLQHRPELFPDPDRFDPDRWIQRSAETLPRGSHVPFGGGNRKCIGDQFALIEMTLALATVCARWELRPDPGATMTVQVRGTLGPGPLMMTCRPRGKEAED
ncbi:cytochrome P450 [Streptomyces sp. NBC_00083]|uniref:cytochrome P450 n=1 Tax=Streptomyces sp. NBC_00083 TaxID=2975647 RepID=UPI002255A82A|nr:cytochrome P450 [Streptomyces sp. NBC_00083]MCX5384120.1 cytochrome P450 [Streptomyces sp. NBC_00083]